MAGLRDLLKGGKDHDAEAIEITKSLKKDFPFVAEVLGGCPATKTEEAVLSGTITIFIHEGKARFSVNVKSQGKTFIGDLADIANPWGSINSALAMGDVSSKRYSERTAVSTAEENGVKLY